MSAALPLVNTHIHLPPNFSAFATVQDAVDQAAEEGVSILGTSNYYDFSVYEPFAQKAAANGIKPLFGVEIVCRIASLVEQGVKINDPGNPGKMYICGKGLRRVHDPTPRAAALLTVIRSGDEARMAAMVALLVRVFCEAEIQASLDSREIVRQVAMRYGVPEATVVLQERHVAQAFQEALFEAIPLAERTARLATLFKAAPNAAADNSVGVQAEIRTHLMKAGKPAYVEENFVTYEEARELILELGGIVCYPALLDGTSPIPGFESNPGALVRNLKELGIDSAEFITNRNKPEVVSEYVDELHANGFSVSAGTEHNTTERIDIVPKCKGGGIPYAAQQLFVEGALRQCAHQDAIALEA